MSDLEHILEKEYAKKEDWQKRNIIYIRTGKEKKGDYWESKKGKMPEWQKNGETWEKKEDKIPEWLIRERRWKREKIIKELIK